MNFPNKYRIPVLHLIFLLSGVAGLGYQLLWTRLFAIGVGHEIISVLSIVGAFFGGLALGSWCLDGPIERSPAPWRWMVCLEAAIGVWGVVSMALIPEVNQWILALGGLDPAGVGQWAGFLLPLLVLLPATFSMGATLPAMERVVSMVSPGRRFVGGLYAANTLGACLGTFLVVYKLAPALGFRKSLLVLSAVNFCCALGTWLVLRRTSSSPRENPKPLNQKTSAARLRLTLFFTGLLGIGYEVLCVRALSQFLENTVYTFASLLIIYLLGTAAGAWVFQKWMLGRNFRRPLEILLAGVLSGCLLGTALLGLTEKVHQSLGEFAAASLLFLPPTFFMGALFSYLLQQARDGGIGLGRSLAFNTLGAALAPFLFGVVLLPAAGVRTSLLIVSAAYGVLMPSLRGWKIAAATSALPIGLIFFLSWDPLSLADGFSLVRYREGIMASIAVEREKGGIRNLKVNNRYQMGSTSNTASERRQAHLPLLLHPHPQRALFLGLGTGITIGAAKSYPDLAADGVELLPEVLEVLPLFAPENSWPFPKDFHLRAADARRFVKASPQRYQVIVADLFHPARDGAGTLYTVEHFQAVRSRLTSDGLFCQWLPLYQMDLPVLKMIVKTFLKVFPNARAFLGNFNVQTPGLALVGTLVSEGYGPGWIESRVGDPSLRAALEKEALYNNYNLFSGYLASAEDLKRFSLEAPLNTDDRPVVMYRAPRFLAGEKQVPYAGLRALIDTWHPDANSLLNEESSFGEFPFQLELVWQARNLYLRGAMAEREGRREDALKLYLKSAALTPHFLASYAICLQMVLDTYQAQPKWAKWLAEELVKARPETEDARIVLEELFPR